MEGEGGLNRRTANVMLTFTDAVIPLYCVSDYKGEGGGGGEEELNSRTVTLTFIDALIPSYIIVSDHRGKGRGVNRTSSVRLAFAGAVIPLYCVSNYRGGRVEQQNILCDTGLH